jgi:hypothetical protein
MVVAAFVRQDNQVSCLTRILLVVERDGRERSGLAKALLLCRHSRAALTLFLCDTEPYREGRGAAGRQAGFGAHLAEGRAYLRALRQQMHCPDVAVEEAVVCAPSLVPALARQLRGAPAELILRTVGEPYRAAGVAFARQLLHLAGAAVLLTRGRAWRPEPHFIEARLESDEAASGPPASLSEQLAQSCGARLEHIQLDPQSLPRSLSTGGCDLVALRLPGSGFSDGLSHQVDRWLRESGSDLLLMGRPVAH